jgi:tetratricopeptide (TPR) repeat protein
MLCAAPAFCGAKQDVDYAGRLLEEGRPFQAVPVLENVLQADRTNAKASALLGVALSSLGPQRAEQAVRLLYAATEREPAVMEYRIALCRAYRQMGDVGQAVEQCKLAMTLDATNTEAYREIGLAYQSKGDTSSALEAWETASHINPDDYINYYYLGMGQAEAGKYALAMPTLRKAEVNAQHKLGVGPNRDIAKIQFALAGALAKTGHFTEARDRYAEAAENDSVGDIAPLAKMRRAALPSSDGAAVLREIAALDREHERELARQLARSGDNVVLPERKTLDDTQKAALSACINTGQEAFNEGRVADAEAQFRSCLSIQPADDNSIISLAGILMVESKLVEARMDFRIGLGLVDQKSSMAAYCNSRLGDIAVKNSSYDEAAKYYSAAVAIDPDDTNSVVGLGRCSELSGDWKAAYDYYARGLSLEPNNTAAREGQRRCEPHVMTDEQILAELKQRRILTPEKTTLTSEYKEYFMQVRNAEEMGAIDYLKRKLHRLPHTYVMEINVGTPQYRLMLTDTGFKSYRGNISLDVRSFFEKQGLSDKAILRIRAMNGKLFYDPQDKGLISFDGIQSYYYALVGQKKYLLPTDPLPPEAMASLSEAERIRAQMQADAFTEISEPEYIWLSKATDCSEDTFTNELDLRIAAQEPGKRLYFVSANELRKDKGMLLSYINRYRRGDTDTSPRGGTAFFGHGGVESHKLCDKQGKIWTGDPNGSLGGK